MLLRILRLLSWCLEITGRITNHTAIFIKVRSTVEFELRILHALLTDTRAYTIICRRALPNVSITQNEAWRYALSTKLNRLSKTGARPYDMSDAVGYLVPIKNLWGCDWDSKPGSCFVPDKMRPSAWMRMSPFGTGGCELWVLCHNTPYYCSHLWYLVGVRDANNSMDFVWPVFIDKLGWKSVK